MRSVVRVDGGEAAEGADGGGREWGVDSGSGCWASAGSGSVARGVAGGRLGEVIEASGMGRAQYRSGSRWHGGQRRAMRAWLWARGIGVPFGDG